MTHTWTHLESASLPGGRRLQAWLGGDERGAFFQTVPGSPGKVETCALVKLIPECLADAETQLALWRRTRLLHHPNLLPLLECGRTNMEGEEYLYAVFEYPDDRLDAATEQRPLSEPEVHAVMASVAEGLKYLHAHGLMHGAIDVRHVVAVGDRIKLATDCLRESGYGEAGQVEDRRMLEELAAELTGTAEQTPVQGAAETLPAPATHAEKQAGTQAGTQGGFRLRTRKLPVPRWIYFGVAGLLLLIVWLNVGRRAAPDSQPAPPPPAAKVVSGPPPRPVFRQPASDSESAPAPKVASKIVAAAPRAVFRQPESGPAPPGRAMWRVIAYTYASRGQAENKVRAISGKWPDLRPQVFVPRGGKGMYLVALGGRMTREEALHLQKRLQEQGLPRDTYVQNYSE